MGKNYCICGGMKWETVRGTRRLYPCFWKDVATAAPVGTGPLGLLHPQCLLAIGLFGFFDTETQTTFENGFRNFIQKRATKFLLVQSLYNLIPPPAATSPNKGADFNPTNFAPNGIGRAPRPFSDGILQIVLTACQQICSSTTLNDLDGGRKFKGTLKGLWSTLYSEDQCPFIDQMRGISPELRASSAAESASYNASVGKRRGKNNQPKEKIQTKAKRRRIKNDMTRMVAGTFQASDVEFNLDCIIKGDPNDGTPQAKALFRQELGIDENWTPRPAKYDAEMIARFTNQVVRDDLILSEAILQLGQHYALHGTLTNPLGDEWKKLNGLPGMLIAAKILQERAGMFLGEKLKKNDTFVWFNLCFKGVINRIQVKHWGDPAEIPEGTVIYMAVIDTKSVYYQNLVTFGISNLGCAAHHEMYAMDLS